MPRHIDPERHYWEELRCSDPQRARAATHVLAALLRQQGKRVAAERLLRDSLRSHGTDGAAGTWVRLGRLIAEEGRDDDAKLAYGEAQHLASVEETPEVVMDVAARYVSVGEMVQGRSLYAAVAERAAQPHLRALAAYRLATIQAELALTDEAIAALRRSLAEADSALEALVLVDLAEFLADRDEDAEAEELLQRAIVSDHHDQAPRAAFLLAQMRWKGGDGLEAYRLYQLVIESEHRDFAARAMAEQTQLIDSELDLLFTSAAGFSALRSQGVEKPFSKKFLFAAPSTRLWHSYAFNSPDADRLPRGNDIQTRFDTLVVHCLRHFCEQPDLIYLVKSGSPFREAINRHEEWVNREEECQPGRLIQRPLERYFHYECSLRQKGAQSDGWLNSAPAGLTWVAFIWKNILPVLLDRGRLGDDRDAGGLDNLLVLTPEEHREIDAERDGWKSLTYFCRAIDRLQVNDPGFKLEESPPGPCQAHDKIKDSKAIPRRLISAHSPEVKSLPTGESTEALSSLGLLLAALSPEPVSRR
jgi:tetratricopeptide (TPR) repeat protein